MGKRRASGFADVTSGAQYPAGYWMAAPSGSDIAGIPAAFVEEHGRAWLAWVEEERERIQATMPSGVFEEWNRRGYASRLASAPGGAWSGAAARIAGLVSDELGHYWSEVAPRMNRSEYVCAAWAARQEEERDMDNERIAVLERDLATVPGEPGARGTYEGMLWEMDAAGWRVIARDVPAAGAGIAGAIAALEAAGNIVTPRMLELFSETIRNGRMGKRGRVIAAAGDFDAAVAVAFGTVTADSKRGAAIAAARDCMGAAPVPALEPVFGFTDEPF